MTDPEVTYVIIRLRARNVYGVDENGVEHLLHEGTSAADAYEQADAWAYRLGLSGFEVDDNS